MRALSMSLFSLCLAGLVIAEDKKPEKYESKEGTFKVLFPGKPEAKEKSQDTKVGAVKFSSFEWNNETKDKFLSVTFVDYPFKNEQYNLKKGLDGAVNGGSTVSGTKVVETKEIEFGKAKLPGRDALMENAEKKVWCRGRYIMDLDRMRMYILVLAGSKDYVTGKDGDAFIDSFELVAKAK